MINPKTIPSVLKPLFYFSKILGLSPFQIHDDRYENSKLNSLWCISLMTAVCGYSLYSINSKAHHAAIVTKITDGIYVHLCIFSLCFGVLFGYIRRQDILDVIHSLSEIDQQFALLNLNIILKEKYRKASIYLISGMFLTIIYVTLVVSLDIAAFAKTTDAILIGELVAYNAPVVTIFIGLQFCVLILLVKQRFGWLNDKMVEIGKYVGEKMKQHKKQIHKTKMEAKSMKMLQNKASTVLEQISIKHYELCNISKKLNKAYSCQILFLILQGFMTIIAMSFYLASYIFSKQETSNRLDFRIYFGPTLAMYALTIVILTVICSSTAKQAQKTGVLLHRVMSLYLCINDGYMDLGVTCFSLQLIHQNVSFTACRLFVIDETLLSSIVGAATTYLVIVLQFEIGVSNGNPANALVNFTTTV